MSAEHSDAQTPLAIPLNASSTLRAVFDQWYEVFWRAELLDRLSLDLHLIRTLGHLSPRSEILDLACAFGRIANALAAERHHVTAIDASQPLLASAKADAAARGVSVEYILSDWRDLSFSSRFDCALWWFSSLGYLSESDDFAVLQKLIQCLKPEGRLMIETRHWDSMRRSFEPTTVRFSGDNLLIENHSYHPETAVQWTRQILLANGQRLSREYGIRRYTFAEMRALCLRAGFSQVRGFDENGTPLQPNSQRCVLVATK